ncbi:hypothetical protein LEP1GSC193_0191 [Leptospira alstonii serovar Pingchang str. 80-412]|uniref:Uncharacterized protein n=2 Tax=Leptospira alstonii TaxID=28452 RepID=M6D2L7_9LEPT|nr:hypothetical protein LEP1GSC194_3840 [Leptospira alstonii serovar Sichuan str. 79601]EQA78948.1 hypothetical protein LEP1GSC193_0191 [Leptospira alstonii serovar Pingchang str. 80-412]
MSSHIFFCELRYSESRCGNSCARDQSDANAAREAAEA